MKCYRSQSTDPFYNLKWEEALLNEDTKEEYVFFWQSENAIVIGRHQLPECEINLSEAEKEGIVIARRITGGGAVYQDLGNLNISFICNSDGEDSFLRFLKPVMEALEQLGVSVFYNDRNDLLINGKKISGSAQLVRNGRVLHHLTLLLHTDLEKMDRVLIHHPEKLKRNQVVSVRSRVTNLFEYLSPEKCDQEIIINVIRERVSLTFSH